MRGKALLLGLWTAALVVALGCHHDQHKVAVPQVEEWKIEPSHEPRFDEPPTANYRKPRTKQEEKTLIGNNKMGGPLGPGF